MPHARPLLLCTALAVLGCGPPRAPQVSFHGAAFAAALFRPDAPVDAALIRAIDLSTASVRAALYEFDAMPLALALLRARRRGVDVELIVDPAALSRRDAAGDPAPISKALRALLDGGVQVKAVAGQPPHGAMHLKFALYDGALLSDGSYNWTDTSEYLHYENEEFITRGAVVEAYGRYWARLWEDAEPAASMGNLGCGEVRFHGAALPACVFSPFGGGVEAIGRALSLTRASADVAMFSFHSPGVAEALVQAARRGVRVRLLLDRDQAREEPFARVLAGRGADVRVLSGPLGPGAHSRMHHKFAVLDRRLVENGSFNYSTNADRRNFDSLRFSDEAAAAAAFEAEFENLWKRAKGFDDR